MSRGTAWSRLPDAVARVASAGDAGLRDAVVTAFSELYAWPVRWEPIAPCRGLALELSDGGAMFGHVVADPPPADADDCREAAEILARYAAARLDAARLREELRRFRTIMDNADIALTVADTHRRTVYANAGLVEISGYTLEELNALPAEHRIHPDDRAAVEAAREANLRGEPTRIRWRTIRKNGERAWIESAARPIYNAAGRVELIVLSSRECTAEVEALERSRRSEERHRIITALTPTVEFSATLQTDGTATVDWIAGHITELGRLGIDKAYTAAACINDLHPDDRAALPELVGRLRRGEKVVWDYRSATGDSGYAARRLVAVAVPDPGLPDGSLRVYGTTFDRTAAAHDETMTDQPTLS
jgi:PAS domain S-box-containing protein